MATCTMLCDKASKGRDGINNYGYITCSKKRRLSNSWWLWTNRLNKRVLTQDLKSVEIVSLFLYGSFSDNCSHYNENYNKKISSNRKKNH